MSRNRFQLLLRFWHFSDNESIEKGRLSKVKLLLDHLNDTMREIYVPDKDLSLDESMMLWIGRLIFRQYIKNKKHKYGVKFYELCESDGIVLRVSIYPGVPYQDIHGLGQTGAIVMKLMEDFLGKGYCIDTDNYYNSVALTKQMGINKTYVYGTLRADR